MITDKKRKTIWWRKQQIKNPIPDVSTSLNRRKRRLSLEDITVI
jgi:hypothetical protein